MNRFNMSFNMWFNSRAHFVQQIHYIIFCRRGKGVLTIWLPEQFPLFVAGTLALWWERAVCAEKVSSAQLSLINHGWWILVDIRGYWWILVACFSHMNHMMRTFSPIDVWWWPQLIFCSFLNLQTGFSTTWSSGGNFQPDFPSESSDDRGSFAQGRGLESFTPDLQEISRSGWTGGTGRSSGWVDRGIPGWPGRKCFAANQEPPETAAKSPLWFRGVRGVVCGEWDSRWYRDGDGHGVHSFLASLGEMREILKKLRQPQVATEATSQ